MAPDPEGHEGRDHVAVPPKARSLSRRSLMGIFGITGATAAIGAAGYAGVSQLTKPAPTPAVETEQVQGSDVVAFDGIHQAGIATPAQSNVVLTAYDVADTAGKAEIAAVMKAWTLAGRALTTGSAMEGDPDISTGSSTASLSITVGVGATLVEKIKAQRPGALVDLPAFAGDQIDPLRSGGDIVVQLCADDPLVLAQADRVLTRLASGTLRVRWQEQGFGSTGARKDGRTGRNLMGQLDGTNNVTTSALAKAGPIWVSEDGPAWLAGGSYLVVRRIRMLTEQWDQTNKGQQERVIGRTKDTGAPLGSKLETDFVDLEAKNPDGSLTIPADSHVRLAKPASSAENMMRRGYSYRGAVLPDGSVDQGLLFLAFQKDPSTSFIPVQQRLAAHDALERFTVTTSSGIFAILPGVSAESDWLGSALFS